MTDAHRIMVLDRNDYNRVRSYAPALLTDPELRVVPVPPRGPEDRDPIYRRLGHRARPGTLLVRNPWRHDEFVEATLAHEELSVQKFALFAGICQRLGATRLDVTEIREVGESGRRGGSADFGVGAVRGGTSLTSRTAQRVASRITARWTWGGGPGDPAGAAEQARATGLDTDHVIMGLIDQRRYGHNPLAEHHLELDLSTDVQRELQAAVRVQSIAGRLGPSFRADLETLHAQTTGLRLDLTVAFP